MLKKMIVSAGMLALIVAFLISCTNDSKAESKGKGAVVIGISKATAGKNGMPEFTFKYNGKETKFSDFVKGKAVFLNFWGTWCPPCRAEIPSIIELAKEYKGKDLVIVGIAVGNRREPVAKVDDVQSFVDEKGINYINFVDDLSIQQALGGIYAVPTTFIFNKQGEKIETIVGGREKEGFIQSIKKAMD